MRRTLVGTLMTDSSQIMVGDPAYLRHWTGHDFDGDAPDTDRDQYPYGYQGACEASLAPARAGVLGPGYAAAASTGDRGTVTVYLETDDDGTPLRLVTEFGPPAAPLTDADFEVCPECGRPLDDPDSPDGLCTDCRAATETAAG